jgi:hypothetical protein
MKSTTHWGGTFSLDSNQILRFLPIYKPKVQIMDRLVPASTRTADPLVADAAALANIDDHIRHLLGSGKSLQQVCGTKLFEKLLLECFDCFVLFLGESSEEFSHALRCGSAGQNCIDGDAGAGGQLRKAPRRSANCAVLVKP